MKRITIFGKKISVLLIVLLVIGVIGVSGALLQYFGQITATVEVEQAITIDGPIVSELEVTGSETDYSDEANIVSNTVNDLEVIFSNDCNPDCDGITITNMVELSVVGFGLGTDGFESANYKATDYQASGELDDLYTVTYAFKITNNDFGVTNLAPYVVLVGAGIGPVDVAVHLIPDGGTYNEDVDYIKTVDDTTEFHLPGPANWCSQGTPCTLAEIKDTYPSATVNRIRAALGAWPGDPLTESISILMGISTIDGVQAKHMKLKMYGMSTVPTIQKYDFVPDIEPGTYTITTTVDLVE